MRRFFITVATMMFALVGIVFLAGQPALASQANVQNFTIERFESDLYLNKDSEGRSTVKVVETITAHFPNANQNHGIERALPEKYDGHSTNLTVQSVTNMDGHNLEYSKHSTNGNTVLRIGNPDTYVKGQQTYVITYVEHDITRFFSNTNADEFYRNINGTQWSQPIKELEARVHVDASLASSLNGNVACYKGREGSAARCPLVQDQNVEDKPLFTTTVLDLKPNENVTIALGFNENTFAAYQKTAAERFFEYWIVALIVSAAVAIVAITLLAVRYNKVVNKGKKQAIIVPEYIPPKQSNILISANLLKNAVSDIPAQIVDFAVRHYVKIYEVKEKTFWTPAEYEIRLAKMPDNLSKEEQEILALFFGKNAKINARTAIKDLSKKPKFYQTIMTLRKTIKDRVRGEYGLYALEKSEAKLFKQIGLIALCLGVVTLSPPLLIVSGVSYIFASYMYVLTEKGLQLWQYLEGLKMYITLAEKDRLKLLQSPEGAKKVGVKIGENDDAKLVKLYERVLPYAVLMGIEKEWANQLGLHYEAADSQPDWYVGTGAFNAVMFSSAVSGFSSQSSSYTSPSSSSDGGSSGGGYSGGGSGGGGGGGW